MLKDIKECIDIGNSNKILFIKFEDLCKNPNDTMKIVYQYLGLPYYQHDFNNIQQVTFEDDRFHGRYGDHKIQNKVTPVVSKAKELLGKEMCDYIYDKTRWYSSYFKYSI